MTRAHFLCVYILDSFSIVSSTKSEENRDKTWVHEQFDFCLNSKWISPNRAKIIERYKGMHLIFIAQNPMISNY